MMRVLTLIGAASALALSGCINDVLNTKPEVRGLAGAAPVQTLNNPDNNTNVTLRPGGKLVVRVESNPTTGYYWQQVGGDDALIVQISEGYLADPAPIGLVGSGGVQEFTFTAVKVGTTTLKLSYQRSADDVAHTRRLEIKIIQ